MSENWMEWMDENKKAVLLEKQRQVALEDAQAYDDYAIDRVGSPPRLRIKKDGEITPKYMCDFAGWKRLMHAFGSNDMEFVQALVCQMARVRKDEDTLNFMVSLVISFKPRDQIEAATVTQLAIAHVLNMELAQYVPLMSTVEVRQVNANLAIKFSRTFVSLLETLKRYRSGGEQKVTVQHVQIQDNAQAIVNSVVHGPASDSSEEVRYWERTLNHDPAQPLPEISEPARSLDPIEDDRRKRTSKRTR
jgi:hypothetical protein